MQSQNNRQTAKLVDGFKTVPVPKHNNCCDLNQFLGQAKVGIEPKREATTQAVKAFDLVGLAG